MKYAIGVQVLDSSGKGAVLPLIGDEKEERILTFDAENAEEIREFLRKKGITTWAFVEET